MHVLLFDYIAMYSVINRAKTNIYCVAIGGKYVYICLIGCFMAIKVNKTVRLLLQLVAIVGYKYSASVSRLYYETNHIELTIEL